MIDRRLLVALGLLSAIALGVVGYFYITTSGTKPAPIVNGIVGLPPPKGASPPIRTAPTAPEASPEAEVASSKQKNLPSPSPSPSPTAAAQPNIIPNPDAAKSVQNGKLVAPNVASPDQAVPRIHGQARVEQAEPDTKPALPEVSSEPTAASTPSAMPSSTPTQEPKPIPQTEEPTDKDNIVPTPKSGAEKKLPTQVTIPLPKRQSN